jgi:hypothetical protein
MTLQEIIEQLESCHYECEAGTLENNVAWRELKERVEAIEELLDNAHETRKPLNRDISWVMELLRL